MNAKPASPAKISRPVLKGYLPRKRLFRLLDKARRSPAIWISGPPGSGKTTLVSSYIEARKIPCLWYQVDEGDADIASFFYYLGMAGGRAAPRKRKPLPLLTPEHLPGLPVFTKRYFEDLYGRLKVPSLLVLDNCQTAAPDSPFHDVVRDAISQLPQGMNAILLSRCDPHPAFARKRANRLMEVVRWNDLRLTLEEAEGMARMRWKSRLPGRTVIRDLHGYSDGWAAGLVLLMERIGREGIEPRKLTGRSAEEVFDYFAGEVFAKLDGEIKEFLQKSVFLPKMTAGMAERVTGVKEASRILSNLVRHNYFTQRHPGEEPIFEYHALFREFLIARAKNAYPAETVNRLLQDAAAALLDGGQVEAAVEVMRQAHDFEGLARVIVSHAPSLVAKGRFKTLLGWLDALPKEIVENEAWLLYWKGVGRMPFSPGESRVRFEEAFRKFDARREAPGVFLAWSGAVDSILYQLENFTQADPWISILHGLLDKYGGFPSEEIGNQVTCSMFHGLVLRRPPGTDVESWAERALAVSRQSPDIRLKIDSIICFFLYQVGKGGFQGAETTLANFRDLLKGHDATPFMRLQVDWMEATLSMLLSMHERSVRVASGALVFIEETGVHFLDPTFLGYGALGSLQVGDFETANRFLRQMAASLGSMGLIGSSFYHMVAACEALGRRELGKAALHSKENIKQIDDSGNISILPTAHLLAAHIYHDLHEDEEAAGHLEQARQMGPDLGSPQDFWLCALTEAYFHLGRNKEASAIAVLREGMRTGREHGLFGTVFWRPGFLEKVCAKALEEGIEVEYVRGLIRRNRLVPDPAQPDLEHWPWPVKVYTLGRFELLREEKPVEFSRKVQQKPLKLLKALIALGGREVAEEQLTDVLWPEADGDQAHRSFTAALHRLRQLLGDEKTVELKEGKLTLSNRHCWVDAWAFERLVGLAGDTHREKGAEGRGERAASLLEKALVLYRGPFLAGESKEPFVVSMRERLRSKFLRAVSELGKCEEVAGRWEEAASCYRKGIEMDDLAEELYRRLMVCHLRQGQEAEALSVFRRCRKTLSTVLGVNPSAATETLLKSLGRPPA